MLETRQTAEQATYPSLRGKTVFITGGSSGIGADLVVAFARQGARVAFVGRNAAAAAQVIAAAGPCTPLFLQCDLADTEALARAVQAAIDALGPISILINNAADDHRHNFLDVDLDYFAHHVAVNLRSHFFAAQRVIPSMRQLSGGTIINVGSTSWKNKVAGYAAYATCKSAMTGLTRSLAREFGPDNIRVNTLTPGWIMTAKQLASWVDADGEAEMDRNHCLPGRILGCDVADMALFLASDNSRMVTAQEFVVDAGWT